MTAPHATLRTAGATALGTVLRAALAAAAPGVIATTAHAQHARQLVIGPGTLPLLGIGL